jgi:hypothetical protein
MLGLRRASARPPRPLITAACAGLLVLALGGCGADSAAPAAEVTPGASPATSASVLTVKDQWVKTAKSDMTAAFGTFVNAGATPVTIVSAKTSASDRTELHEVVMDGGAMTMRAVDGGITVPAGGTLQLKPGGFHIMILDLKKPVDPGAEVTVRLTLGDGSTRDFQALAKETGAGEENYDSATGDGMKMPASTSTP